jgi:WD40 repeat protein
MRPQRYPIGVLITAALVLGCLVFRAAWAQTSDKPLMLIETGRHAGPITAISATKDGSTFATSSRDKTVRIWNSAGRQMQVIRPPVGSRVNDAVNSVAISPDGSLVAYQFSKLDRLEDKGNFVATFPIQVLNLRTEKLVNLGRTLEPARLAFSPDGRYLGWITAFPAELGASIDIMRTTDWSLYARASRGKVGEGRAPATFDFSPDGSRIAATLGDGVQVISIKGVDYASGKLFDKSKCKQDGDSYCAFVAEDAASLKRMSIERTLKPAHGKGPVGARWSPDGKWLAFGYIDAPDATLVSTGNWEQVKLPATNLQTAYLSGPQTMAMLTWSPDSKTLLSTGTMGSNFMKPTVIRQWTVGPKPTYEDEDSTMGKDRKLAIHAMVATNAGYAFSSDDAIGFYEGGRFRVLEPYSGLRGNLSVSNSGDGATIYFRYPDADKFVGDPYEFDVMKRALRPEPRELPESFHALQKVAGMDNFGLRSDRPILNGVRLEIGSRSGAFAFTPDGQTLLIGTSYALYRFDRNGARLWRVDLPAGATALNTSRDGRLALVVLEDGTLRWHRLLDGKELLAFYALNDRRLWAMWTPEGYFDASDAGSIVLYRGVRRGDGLIDAEPLSLSSPMRRPDKIDAAITKLDFIGEAAPIPSRQ